jgi:hypothetical protein
MPSSRAWERVAWTCARHDLIYVAFDLEQFGRAPKLCPTPADAEILGQVVQLLASETDVTASKASSLLSRALPGNKVEREVLMGILGVSGVLASPGHPGFLQHWVPWVERAVPPSRFADLSYPVCWWTGADGVDTTVLQRIFSSARPRRGWRPGRG